MKIPFQKISCLLRLLAYLLAGQGGFSSLAATLTVSPAVISNTYPGVVTLNFGGLSNGETVAVQQWIDGNTNGAIDGGDFMLDAFNITESGAMIIGGITNISVPFDSNPATNAITTTLNFAPPLTLENLTGKRIFRLVSPTGNFTPVTAAFTVTNAATSQSISGTVYSNGVTPVPYAIVAVAPQNGYAAAVVADGSGHYSVNVNPGSYNLIPVAPNYYCDLSAAPVVVLTNGVSATNNLSLSNGTVTITGKIFNAANSNGVGGLMVELGSGNLFAIALTDTNGNYSAAVAPNNFWKIQPIKERLARRAFVILHQKLQVSTSSGNVTNASIAVYQGTALFYGRITDSFNVPFPNIRIDVGDGSNNLYSANSYSDPNGYFAVVALGGVSSEWSCQANDSDNPILASYIINSPDNANIAPGQAILQNFVALPVTAHISGQVHDNLGNVVSGVVMYAGAFIAGKNYSSQNANTDGSGNYSLGVASGVWGVNFSQGGENGLDTAGLVDYFQPHLVSLPPTNAVLNLIVYQNGTPVMSQPQRNAPGQFTFNINGTVNGSYDVQTLTNLAATNWATLYTLTLTNTPFPITDTHATNSQRYYRVKKN